ncbi:putative ribonuclease H-like domain-containing protein [Tanacetum coccineum]
MTHPSLKRNMVPKAVLMMSGLVSLTTTRPVNTAQPRTTVNNARPMTNVYNKAYLTVRRPINNKSSLKNSNFNKKVNIVSGKNVNIARPKAVVDTAKPKALLNAIKGNHINAIKTSACWVWKPKTKGNPQMDLKDQGVIDSGCSRHMIGNMSYLTDFEEIDGGYIAFGGNPKGGKITGKCTIKTGNLEFENVFAPVARIEGYTQKEGIADDKVFAPIARIESIRLFLSYALFKDFVVYQMDVKSAFLYGKIENEVYVCQPLGFEDPNFPDRVYKVEKTLYGIHQGPRAWYETLSTYLLDNGFQRGKIDKTLFIRNDKGDILLVQVLISWQCEKQTVVANSTIEAEYVAAFKLMWVKDNRRLDVFGTYVISRKHRVLCDLGQTFHYFRNHGSFVSNVTSSGNTFQVLLWVSNRVTWESSRSRGGMELGNIPLIHLEFEELELDRWELDKQEVEQPEVDRFDLAEPGVGKLKLD